MRYGRRAARAANAARHTAHGIEITSHDIRLVRLSRPAGGGRPGQATRGTPARIQVDDVVRHPLAPGIVAGADILDVESLSRALEACFAQQAARLAQRAAGRACGRPGGMPHAAHATHAVDADASADATRVALALCPSVVTQGTVALDELIPGFSMRLPGRLDAAAFDALAPWVSLHAQKISGIDPGELIVDWYQDASGDPERVVVAASQRHYLDIRHRVADAAGLRMGALCDASIAALDACRFVVAQCLHTRCDDIDVASTPHMVGGACFSPVPTAPGPTRGEGGEACPAWANGAATAIGTAAPATSAADAARLVAEARRVYVREGGGVLSPAADTPRFAALWLGEGAWRAWAFEAQSEMLEEWALPEVREPAALLAALRERGANLALTLVAGECDALTDAGGLRAVGSALRCPVIEFDASTCCDGPAATSQHLGPAAAVAFGLALRELLR